MLSVAPYFTSTAGGMRHGVALAPSGMVRRSYVAVVFHAQPYCGCQTHVVVRRHKLLIASLLEHAPC